MVVASSFGFAALRAAPVLREVEKHLSIARDDIQRRAFDSAIGHSSAVLIGDNISYNVSFESVPVNQRRLLVEGLDSALSTWERSMRGSIRFQEVDSAVKAQIAIVFKPSVAMGHEEVAGFTNWRRSIQMDGDRLVQSTYHADMQLRVLDLGGQVMPLEVIRHEACHEVGHVLGLDDSEVRGDIMAPLQIEHPVNGPSESEVLAVRNVRDEAKRIQAAAKAQDSAKL